MRALARGSVTSEQGEKIADGRLTTTASMEQ